MEIKPRVRFAPSPTGFLHIGGARTALYNWLFARHHGGTFILRIEDTDIKRNIKEAVEGILDGMSWLGLTWDEGPYYQSQRLDIYREAAGKLLREGKAYRCYCSPEELARAREEAEKEGRPQAGYDGRCAALSEAEISHRERAGIPYAIRFRVPKNENAGFDDLTRGRIEFDSSVLEDFVILKSDGMPTYNFAVAVDDADMKITHVIRGDDHISNTPKQILIFRALGFEPPRFAHLPMILGADKTKLSKRHGAMSVTEYREMGYIPDAIINHLALLGWSLDGTAEFFTREELIEKFSLERVGSTPSVFDFARLDHMNQEHLKRMDISTKARLVRPFLEKKGLVPPVNEEGNTGAGDSGEAVQKKIEKIVAMVGDRLKKLSDIIQYADFFFSDSVEFLPEAKKLLETGGYLLPEITSLLSNQSVFEAGHLEPVLREFARERNTGFGRVAQVIRAALTGKTFSPGLFEVMELLGKEKTLSRLMEGAKIARNGEGQHSGCS